MGVNDEHSLEHATQMIRDLKNNEAVMFFSADEMDVAEMGVNSD